MSKPSVSLRVTNSTLLALLVVGAGYSTMACSKEEEAPKRTWACQSIEIPAGEAIRCTSQAMVLDSAMTSGSATSDGATSGDTTSGGTTSGTADTTTSATDGTSTTGASTTSGGTTGGTTSSSGTTGSSDGTSTTGTGGGTTGGTSSGGAPGSSDGDVIVFECPLGNDNPDCPDVSHGNGKGNNGNGKGNGGANGSWNGGNGNGGGANRGGNGGSSGGSPSGGGANGGGTGASSDGTSVGGGSSSGGAGGGADTSKPPECSWVPELPYCNGSSDGTTAGGSSSGGSSSGDTASSGGNGKGNGNGNGNGNGAGDQGNGNGNGGASSGATEGNGGANGGTASGAASGGGSGGGSNGNGGGHSFTCVKDKKGGITCDSTPTKCAAGTRPSSCGACIDEGDSGECVPPTQGGCWVTGGGFIEGPTLAPVAGPADGHDNFGGNAKPMKQGYVSGHWNHVDHGAGNHAVGRPEYIVCRTVANEPGPSQPGGKKGLTTNQVYFGGHARWRNAADATWSGGYWFDVVAEDHGEPGSTGPAVKKGQMPDYYHFTIRKMDDPNAKISGAIVYETKGDLVGGNIQIHPSNNGHPGVTMSLPPWVALEN